MKVKWLLVMMVGLMMMLTGCGGPKAGCIYIYNGL